VGKKMSSEPHDKNLPRSRVQSWSGSSPRSFFEKYQGQGVQKLVERFLGKI